MSGTSSRDGSSLYHPQGVRRDFADALTAADLPWFPSGAMAPPPRAASRRRLAALAAVLVSVVAAAVAMIAGWWTPWAAGLLTGVDVSHHQGRIDWSALAGTDVRFAYLKATEGGSHVDPRFRENWEGARAAGIPRGAYHFFTLCRPGVQQAANFLATVPADPDALAPALDLEHMGPCREGPAMTDVPREVGDFLARVEAARGRRPILYVTEEFHALHLRGLRGERFWIRALFQRPDFRTEEWVLWQHHNRGRRRGVQGPVDLNALRGPLATLRAAR
ncbi:MAG: GH25 family lysozyme [Polyangiales bacterium]